MVKPSKIIAVGLNYKDHAKELGLSWHETPIIFIKPVSTLIGNGDKIILPSMSKRVDYESELALVIKDKCKDLEPSQIKKHVKGFMCLNDVTASDLQKKDGQWTRGKSFDTFCPIGKVVPWKGFDPNNLRIQGILNDKIVQDSNTSKFIFKIEEVVSFISKIMTLNKGDIITTGTPPGIGPMKKGDKIEVKIEKIGSLINYVK